MSNISRSEYQRVVEENKKLKKDIIILCDEQFSFSFRRLWLIKQWRDKIENEKTFTELLIEVLYGARQDIINAVKPKGK